MQPQDDGLLSINAFETGMTGNDLQTWKEHNVEKFFDELMGVPLDPEHVRLAKIEEVEFQHTFPAYEEVDESEATGNDFFFSTRWTLTNKGDAQRPDIRARFTGREIKKKSQEMEDTFAATLPLESLNYNATVPNAQEVSVAGRTGIFRVGRVACTFPFQESTGAVLTAASRRQQAGKRWVTATNFVRNSRCSQRLG